MMIGKIDFFYLFIVVIILFGACSKEEDANEGTFTITVSAFSLNNGIYEYTGNDLDFQSEGDCQVWSRTAMPDQHSSSNHLHYNAASNVDYNSLDTILIYTEYGPELDQNAIENTCATAVGGVTKTVSSTTYYQDKPNVYLKITEVVKN